MFKKIVCIFGLFFALHQSSICADLQRYRSSSIEKLDNGVSVVFIDTTLSEYVLVMLCISAGVNDEIEKSGIANLTSKLFSKKLNNNANEFHYGAESNTYLGYDQTAYYFYSKKEHLEDFIKNLGSVFYNSMYKKDDVNECKQIIERNINAENQLDKLVLRNEVRKALYWHSKYGDNPNGDIDSLKKILISDLIGFKKSFYTNDRATIIIAGKVDKEKTISLIKKYFAEKTIISKMNRLEEPPHHGSTTKIIKESSQIMLPVVELYWKLPNYREEKDKALHAEIFVTALENLLQKNLEQQKIDVTLSFDHSFWNYKYGDLCVTVTAKYHTDVDNLITSILSEIKCIAFDGLTKEDASLAVKKMQATSDFWDMEIVQAIDQIFKKLGACYDFEFVKVYKDYIKNYKLDDVNKYGKEMFKQDPVIISILNPAINRTNK